MINSIPQIGPSVSTSAQKNAQLLSADSGIPVCEPRFPRLKLREIFSRPRLEYLVQGIFVERGTGVLTNDYGGFKSFIALDLGLSVATGRAWHGRAVKKRPVIYIVAEGAYETESRAKAWLQYHGIEEVPDNFEIIEIPVQIANTVQCTALINELRQLSPGFVILDTLAKCNLGRDENDTGAMGLFTDGMETISRELGAFVLAIHHNNKNGSARGSVSLPANVDASIVLKRAPNRIVTVECDRVKGAPFENFSLVGRIVQLDERDEYGNNITSLVFEATDAPAATNIAKADQTREQVLLALQNAPKGLTATKWSEATGLSSSRFYDHRDALVKEGRVVQNGRIYQVAPIAPIYSESGNSERKNHSDYSDDVTTSEQTELNGAKSSTRSNQSRNANAAVKSEPYRVPTLVDMEGDEV